MTRASLPSPKLALPVLFGLGLLASAAAFAAGGDTCAAPTAIPGLPYNDSGNTSTATNSPVFLSEACAGAGKVTREGPDLIYAISVFPGNSLTFTLTPTTLTYDPLIFILSTCGSGSSCVQLRDVGKEGQAETLGPITLPTGTNYIYVDSIFPLEDKAGAGAYTLSVTGNLGTPNNTNFYTLTPCRVVDTRAGNGPALLAENPRPFVVTGQCEIPAGAKSISVNVTIADPSSPGFVTVWPAGAPLPGASTINFRTGQTRANNALIPVGAGGAISAVSGQAPGNTVHFIVDVNGYFQ